MGEKRDTERKRGSGREEREGGKESERGEMRTGRGGGEKKKGREAESGDGGRGRLELTDLHAEAVASECQEVRAHVQPLALPRAYSLHPFRDRLPMGPAGQGRLARHVHQRTVTPTYFLS
jgi:hypothetical protein